MYCPEIKAFPAAVLNRGLVLLVFFIVVFETAYNKGGDHPKKNADKGSDGYPKGDNERLEYSSHKALRFCITR